MSLNLMYITNSPEVALIAEDCGVDRIFVDMEYIGKAERQGGMDTVQSHHTIKDIENIADVLTKSELLVRINPIHDNSKEEIDLSIKSGADILMLPYFKTTEEVETFIDFVGKRAKTMLLLETPEAAEQIDEILQIPGIDSIHIGLNDLSLGYKKRFMFELLCDGTVEKLCEKIKDKDIPYGFGGVASLGRGAVPAEMIIKEHYRLGSGCAILSRSFCDVGKIENLDKINEIFKSGLREIRKFEIELEEKIKNNETEYFEKNHKEMEKAIDMVLNGETK